MKAIVMFFLILFLPLLSYADEIITGQYCFTYGDNESLKEARDVTRTLAIRNAIESYKTFIESSTKVANFQLTNDIVQILSSGYLKDIKAIEHTENGRTICDKISAAVEPKQFEIALQREVQKRVHAAEEKGVDQNDKLKILRVFAYDSCSLGAFVRPSPCIKVIVKSLKSIAFPGEYIYLDYYDQDGLPIGGDKQSVSYIDIGEMKAFDFFYPKNTKSWRVWLAK